MLKSKRKLIDVTKGPKTNSSEEPSSNFLVILFSCLFEATAQCLELKWMFL